MEIIETGLEFAYYPGVRASTDYIILHHAAADGDVQAIHRYHRFTKGWAGIAYHFYVTKDGEVYRGRPEEWNGGHTGGYNHNSIGICFEGNFQNETMGEAQAMAGQALVDYLREKYPTASVTTHGAVNATACPGANFPLARILEEPDDAPAADIPSAWAAESTAKAINAGVIQGDGSGNYGWHQPVTLERMLVILDRLGVLD